MSDTDLSNTTLNDSKTLHSKGAETQNSKSSKKRQLEPEADDSESSVARKVTKLHPFFSKPGQTTSAPFQWVKPSLGPKRTCLHGVNMSPESRPKIAAFDLDGTVIKSNHKNRSKNTALQWEWWKNSVPSKLQELHQEGFSIIFISNQALKGTQIEDWKKKIPLIAAALPSVPFRIFAATAKDGYRKPMPGMWYELERMFKADNIEIDKASSFFVGDAAGRPDDFASTDRKWALNIDIPFHTPEASVPPSTTTPKPVSLNHHRPELVLFVGYPCLGKSSFYRHHFEPAEYIHINQDTLGTRAKCVKAVTETLDAGDSCVVDNTNRDISTRKLYIDLAKKKKIPIRCFVFTGSMELAWHNNLYRAYNLSPVTAAREPKRDILPYLAFLGFRDNYEEPQLSEGFTEIQSVDWTFRGDEEDRKRWSMWLQIDGK
ncbi:hypothetical protein SERLADRAFT_449528 [Serpula lacrymans var. lacrymans S7.9]|uniref:PNK3P-domain-containing protein n=1 Tax=Serpula lacrymans var. lacrymans (strain S7.9) TaxID=578457 RepID=F8NXW5_SERL9|nr:uncharacterized protein SERLADRAFT_449528 [Serpula lacrymans var. lacrymans S7.9]EGO24781.1 hypothetical protein SERLADRAFT_449528 [Serpula lacrymans var. lacrymans S7.9]